MRRFTDWLRKLFRIKPATQKQASASELEILLRNALRNARRDEEQRVRDAAE